MEGRRFGRTGLQIPAMTFGGGWVGGVLIHGSRAEAFGALDLATEAGIDWIDTAGPLPEAAIAALDQVWKGPAFTHG